MTAPPTPDARPSLRADCSRCFALCCVAYPFARSADFAFEKAPESPCRNLGGDDRCTVHEDLLDRGMRGCVTYDCHGAGQQVSQVTMRGRSWREDVGVMRTTFAVFPVVRALHELLWLLADALVVPAAAPWRERLQAAYDATEELAAASPDVLVAVDLQARRRGVDELLQAVSTAARATVPGAPTLRRADLSGHDLRHRRLVGADLRGAVLIEADLRGADLRSADLIGADLRGADVRGADLSAALFLAAYQVASARGDVSTRISAALPRPTHWT